MVDLVRVLVKKGAKLNAQNVFKKTALIIAAEKNHPVICEILIKAGAKVDIKDVKSNTAFDYASSNGNKELAQMLKNAK